jgi:hypothetical protein
MFTNFIVASIGSRSEIIKIKIRVDIVTQKTHWLKSCSKYLESNSDIPV